MKSYILFLGLWFIIFTKNELSAIDHLSYDLITSEFESAENYNFWGWVKSRTVSIRKDSKHIGYGIAVDQIGERIFYATCTHILESLIQKDQFEALDSTTLANFGGQFPIREFDIEFSGLWDRDGSFSEFHGKYQIEGILLPEKYQKSRLDLSFFWINPGMVDYYNPILTQLKVHDIEERAISNYFHHEELWDSLLTPIRIRSLEKDQINWRYDGIPPSPGSSGSPFFTQKKVAGIIQDANNKVLKLEVIMRCWNEIVVKHDLISSYKRSYRLSFGNTIPLGAVISSVLPLPYFTDEDTPDDIVMRRTFEFFDPRIDVWAPCDGRSIEGSHLATMFRISFAPDLRDVYIRGRDSMDDKGRSRNTYNPKYPDIEIAPSEPSIPTYRRQPEAIPTTNGNPLNIAEMYYFIKIN